MLFLISMLTLLGTTIISLILNFNCYKNYDLPRNDDKFLYQDLFLPEWFYSEAFVITVTLLCIAICGSFILLVL